MPESAAPPESVRIDRLVLDLPGLQASRVPQLALEIARRLTQVGLAGECGSVNVTLDGPGGDVADRIAAALRAEFSR
jgi:hypothetical protein